ncbi:MAG TPA: TatD family hydrolase [Candidatus Saccharimonadales bacterium]|nr:TatD family hydrolase [Candidatus Saccharimonadales bacterium]
MLDTSKLFDTHCHVHETVKPVTPVYDKWHDKGAKSDPDEIIAAARDAGVGYMLCIGTTPADSELAVDFVQNRPNMWASIGIHPHEAAAALQNGTLDAFAALVRRPKVVAVGECGLDYFYNHSPKEAQLEVLRFQIELALKHDLPLSFHVREAFDDFWPVFESYKGIRGVLHSYTDNLENLERAVSHGLYVGVNGIATFAAKDEQKRVIYRTIPQRLLLLETDAPFLTPVPFRGTICEPKHVAVTAEFVSKLRDEPLAQMIAATTDNAGTLFNINI